MVPTRHAVTTAVLIGCLVGAPLSGPAVASEPAPPASSALDSSFLVKPASPPADGSRFVFSDEKLREALAASDAREAGASAYGQWGWHGGGHRHGRNGASQAAIIFGSIATIAGTGLLIYSNRPECDAHVHSNDCYGEKVFGGSLLAAGAVSLVVGITTWH